MGGTCSIKGCQGDKRNECTLLVGKLKGNDSLRRPKCRWLENIERDLGEKG
jgi:hypothetical protein